MLNHISTKGLSGFTCEVTGTPISFDECYKCALRGAPGCSMTPAVIKTAINSIRDPDYADKLAFQAGADVGFSVTELLGCPRQLILKARNPYYEKPSALYRMNRGTGYHDMLSTNTTNGISEKTLDWKFSYRGKSILLVGTPDLIEWTQHGWHITDYKVTGKPPFWRKVVKCPICSQNVTKHEKDFYCVSCEQVVKNKNGVRVNTPPEARSSHIQQVNLYALLVQKNIDVLRTLVPEASEHIAGAQIVYFGETVPVRCSVDIDFDNTLAFLKEKLSALIDDELPPVLTDTEELWRCDYCPVRSTCEQKCGHVVGKSMMLEVV